MSGIGAVPRAAVPVSNARAEASRRNGSKSRGPKTLEGKARSAQNALKHGLRAAKYVVLAEEDAGEFAGLEAAMIAELAPVGALQTVLARRVAVAAWRLARADRLAAGTGLGPRSPTRRPTGRPVRGALVWRCRPWPRPDPGRQRDEVVRDALALPRCGDGRVLACATHAQGAPGRADRAGRARAGRPRLGGARRQTSGAAHGRRAGASKPTRARRRAPDGARPARTTDARRSARACRALAAE
jgi:hypothetical protein